MATKWEYAEVILRRLDAERRGSISSAQADLAIYRYDEKHEEKQGPFGKVMAYMGDNGWELAATTIAQGGEWTGEPKAVLLFKRPKP